MGVGAIIGQSLMSYQSQRAQVAANNAAVAANQAQLGASYAHSFAQMEYNQHQNFEDTITQLQKTKKSVVRQIASIQAAAGEQIGGEGRTSQAVVKAAESDANDTITTIKQNYERTVQATALNEAEAKVNMQNAVAAEGAKMQSEPSLLGAGIGLAAGLVSYNTQQAQISLMRTQAGIASSYKPDWSGLSSSLNTSKINISPTNTTYTPKSTAFKINI